MPQILIWKEIGFLLHSHHRQSLPYSSTKALLTSLGRWSALTDLSAAGTPTTFHMRAENLRLILFTHQSPVGLPTFPTFNSESAKAAWNLEISKMGLHVKPFHILGLMVSIYDFFKFFRNLEQSPFPTPFAMASWVAEGQKDPGSSM